MLNRIEVRIHHYLKHGALGYEVTAVWLCIDAVSPLHVMCCHGYHITVVLILLCQIFVNCSEYYAF